MQPLSSVAERAVGCALIEMVLPAASFKIPEIFLGKTYCFDIHWDLQVLRSFSWFCFVGFNPDAKA